jgi:hypothetical protein
MTIGLLFWIIMIIGFLFGLYTNRTTLPVWAGNSLVQWVLFALLGWAVFGAAIHR